MNKEVIIKDGRVLVKNHLGEEKEVLLIDNLDDLLIQENIVELMEKVIYELEKCSNNFKKSRLIDILYGMYPIISTLSVPTLLMYLNTGSLEGIINTKFGPMEKSKFLALFISAFSPIAYKLTKKIYQEYYEEVKKEKGRLLALYHLKSNIVIQKEILNNLRTSSIEIPIVGDMEYLLNSDAIDNLEDHINIYCELGYNIKEYYEYFRTNGCLPDEVINEYNEQGIKIIEDYLRNNGTKIKKIGSK